MKKLITIIVLLCVCILLCGCAFAGGENLETRNDTDYRVLINHGSMFVYEFKDSDTGVWYIATSDGGATPKLNIDGSLYVESEVDTE